MLDLLFLALMILSCGYASIAGARDGRLVSLVFWGAWLASFPELRFHILPSKAQEWSDAYLFAIDLAVLGGLWTVARISRRYWPIWLLGIHFANLSTDLIILFGNGWRPAIAYPLHAFWSIPELIVMPVGIHFDRAAGLARTGAAAEDRRHGR